jgi:F420-dependent oxidoreductase-like protein
MKVSTQVTYARTFREAVQRIVTLERLGLDMVWVGEAYGFDAVTRLGYLAAKTERVVLATGALPVFSRTPALIAQTAATLDHLSGGRFALGLGTSGPQVIEGWHGVPFDRPLRRTREIVEVCRLVWRGERLTYAGDVLEIPLSPSSGLGSGKPLRLMAEEFSSRIPIYIAALGPANVELAAELADGWLSHLFWPEKADQVWSACLEVGRGRRAEDLAPLEIVAGATFAVGADTASAREEARHRVALYIGGMGPRGRNFYHELACRYGFAREAAVVQDLYLAGRRDEAAAAVPEPLLEAATVCGPAGYVRERLSAYQEAGVTNLIVNPLGEDPVRTFATVREWVG